MHSRRLSLPCEEHGFPFHLGEEGRMCSQQKPRRYTLPTCLFWAPLAFFGHEMEHGHEL